MVDDLYTYFREVQRIKGPTPAEGLRLLATLQQLELESWALLLAHRDSRARIRKLMGELLAGRQPVRGKLTPERVRYLDIDRRVISALRADPPEVACWPQVVLAERQADNLRQQFITSNLKLVVKLAMKFLGRGLELPDLVQEGNLGLMRAIPRFDLGRGCTFSTYAIWWIKQGMRRAVQNHGALVRVPVHCSESRSQIHRTVYTLSRQLGRLPTLTELAADLGLSEERVLLSLRPARMVPIDSPIGNTDLSLGDALADGGEPLEELLQQAEEGAVLRRLLTTLRPKEQAVLRLRFGLGGERQKLKEIGDAWGYSRERIRQIEAAALAKLRRALERKGVFGG